MDGWIDGWTVGWSGLCLSVSLSVTCMGTITTTTTSSARIKGTTVSESKTGFSLPYPNRTPSATPPSNTSACCKTNTCYRAHGPWWEESRPSPVSPAVANGDVQNAVVARSRREIHTSTSIFPHPAINARFFGPATAKERPENPTGQKESVTKAIIFEKAVVHPSSVLAPIQRQNIHSYSEITRI
jgi:hypothetical protein